MKKTLIAVLVSTALLSGCMTADDPNQRAQTGALIGAVAGAVIGHQVNSSSGRYVGALVGALAGGAVGNYMDNQQRELDEQLRREQEANQLEIERLKDDTLKLTLDSEVSFDFNRSDIKPAFKHSLNKLASVIVKYDRTIVHVVGHTDSIGSEQYNQALSERRAESVAAYLRYQGVNGNRMTTSGAGELEPRATNQTEAGRQLNRRVEIFLKPIVEGDEQRAYQQPY